MKGCEDERRKSLGWLVPVVLIYPSHGLPSSPVHRLQSSSQKISGHLGKSKSLVSFFHRKFNQLDKSTFQLYQKTGISGRKETRVQGHHPCFDLSSLASLRPELKIVHYARRLSNEDQENSDGYLADLLDVSCVRHYRVSGFDRETRGLGLSRLSVLHIRVSLSVCALHVDMSRRWWKAIVPGSIVFFAWEIVV